MVATLFLSAVGRVDASISHICNTGPSPIPLSASPTLFQRVEITPISTLTLTRLILTNVETAQTGVPGTVTGGTYTFPVRKLKHLKAENWFAFPPFGGVWKLDGNAVAWGNLSISGVRVPIIMWEDDCEDINQVFPYQP